MRRGRLAVMTVFGATMILGVGVVPSSPASAAGSVRCQGKTATVVVPGNSRRVLVRARNQVIVALGSGDVITAGPGNDIICAGAAKSIDAGPGNDHVTFWGSPVVYGGLGNDTITQLPIPGARKQTGSPTIYGDAGNDTITLGPGNGRAFGGDGTDVLSSGTVGRQTLDGGAGNDVLTERGATATLIGGLGDDIFVVPAIATSRTTVKSEPGDLVNGVRVPSPAVSPVIPPQPAVPTGSPSSGPPVSSGPPAAPPASLAPAPPSVSLTVEGQVGDPALVSNAAAYQSATNLVVGLTVGSNAITSWSLDFGDGSPAWSGPGAPPASVAHRYFVDGRYVATLTVADSAGLAAKASLGVDVANRPTVTETGSASPVVVTAGATSANVTETITAAPIANATLTTYDVSWDDDTPDDAGLYASPLTVTHNLAIGNHRVCWLVYDDHQNESGNCRQVMVVDGAPHVVPYLQVEDDAGANRLGYPGPTPTTAETDDSVIVGFDRCVPGDGTTISSFSIDWGDGSAVTSAQPDGFPRHDFTTPGNYTITTTMTDADGGTAVLRSPMNVIAAGLTAKASVAATEVAGSTIAVDTTGTAAAPGAPIADWFLNWSDGLVQQGTGAPPATITRPAVAGVLQADFYVDDSRYDEDGVGLFTTVTSTVPTANPALRDNVWTPATLGESYFQSPGGVVPFGAPSVAPSTGHTLTSATATFGDGSPSQTVNGPFSYGDVGIANHAYSSVGSYPASIAISDDAPTTSLSHLIVDVAGAGSLTVTPSDANPVDGETVTLKVSAAPGSGAVADYHLGSFSTSAADQSDWSGDGLPQDISFTVHGASGTKLAYSLQDVDNHGGFANADGSLTIR